MAQPVFGWSVGVRALARILANPGHLSDLVVVRPIVFHDVAPQTIADLRRRWFSCAVRKW